MDIAEAILRAKRGNSILFLGSGLGFYAKNEDGEAIPSGRILGEMLCEELGEPPTKYTLSQAADIFSDERTPEALERYLRLKLTEISFDNDLSELCSVPWLRIYTTNYDTVIERAYEDAKSKYVSYRLQDDHSAAPVGSTPIVHIHGKLDERPALDGLILGDQSYLENRSIESHWYHIFLNDVAHSDSIIFLGYSLSDLDLARIIFSRPELHDKIVIIAAPDADARELARLGKFGSAQPLGYGGVLRAIREAKDEAVDTRLPFISLDEIALPDVRTPTSADIFDLLVRGTIPPAAFVSQLRGGGEFSLVREAQQRALHSLAHGITRIVAHSHLANGKTTFATQMALALADRGYRTFVVSDETLALSEEIARVGALSGSRAIVFDNMLRHREAFLSACINLPQDVVIVGTTPTTQFIVEYSKLIRVIPNLAEFDLNEFRRREIDDLIRLLSDYGIWGEDEKLPHSGKVDIIQHRCRLEIRSLVLYLFENSSISSKIASWEADLSRVDSRLSDVMIAALVLARANLRFSLEEILAFAGLQIPVFRRISDGTAVEEILNSKDGRLRVSSPVLADYLLERCVAVENVAATLIRILSRLNENYHLRPYKEAAQNILRYAFLTKLLVREGNDDIIVAFYDQVRLLKNLRDDPQFWLQFAMARMSRHEWEKAELYIQTSYAKADLLYRYRTHMIDDQNARFLLQSRADGYKQETYYPSLLKAIIIIREFLNTESPDVYPFRTANNVLPFYRACMSDCPEDQKLVLKNFCEFVLAKIDDVDERVKRYGEISECRIGMQTIIQELA